MISGKLNVHNVCMPHFFLVFDITTAHSNLSMGVVKADPELPATGISENQQIDIRKLKLFHN